MGKMEVEPGVATRWIFARTGNPGHGLWRFMYSVGVMP
jgi:hypothetical protein